jgi:hypothetical protein
VTGNSGRPGYDTCGGKTRAGGRCTRPAGWGTQHPGIGSCKLHSGSTPNGRAHAERVEAERACAALGIPIRTTPAQALRDELDRAVGAVAWLREQVAKLPEADLFWGRTGRVIRTNPGGGAQPGQPQVELTEAARPHPLLALLLDERKRAAGVAVEMSRLRIEDRQAQIDKELGHLVVEWMSAVLGDLGHDVRDPAIGEIVARRAREIEAPPPVLRVVPDG